MSERSEHMGSCCESGGEDTLNALKPSRERVKEEKIKQVLQSGKLQFDKLGLYGRTEEVRTLKACLAAVSENTTGGGRVEMALIYGESGVGKTALALALEGPTNSLGGIFVSGKYERSLKDKPFAALSMACNQLCREVIELGPRNEKYQQIQSDIRNAGLGDLWRVIGKLPSLLEEEGSGNHQAENDEDAETIFVVEDKEQLNASLISFFSIFSNHFAPLVILLDDFQWADDSSLEFLKSCLGKLPASVMVVGSVRSNEVDNKHLFARTVHQLKSQQKEGNSESFHITEISVGNLSVKQVESVLVDLLSAEPSSPALDQLAEVCHRRTQGNVFFVKQFLSMLEDEGLLRFHVGTFQWDWSIAEIEQRTFATSNLVDLIQSRMKKLGKDAVQLLILASCLGNTFDQETLYLIWRKTTSSGEEVSEASAIFDSLLKMALDDLCFEATGAHNASLLQLNGENKSHRRRNSGTYNYRFAHDKIQEAAISLIPADEFSLLHHRLGMILFNHLPKGKLESLLFVVTNLLNKGMQESVDIAHLNLRAAIQANSVSAYPSVSYYAHKGIENLFQSEGEDSKVWKKHLDLALKLYSLCASAEKELGNVEVAEQYCEKVLQQKLATPLQRCHVWQVKLAIYHNQGKKEALELALGYLSELGCELPKRRIARNAQSSLYLRQTKKEYLLTKDEIPNIPVMDDQEKIWAMALLEEAGSLAYVLQKGHLYTLIRCQYVRWIKKYGLTKDAASAFASFSNVLAHKYGDFDTAKELAELSLLLQESRGSRFSDARTLGTAYGYVLSWTTPLQSTVKHFLAGYNCGMKSGNLFSAGSCLLFYVIACYQSGTNLKLLLEDCKTYIPQLDRLSLNLAADLMRPFWQTVENLIGSENTSELSGNVIKDEKKFFDSTVAKGAFVAKCCVLVHFGKFEDGAAFALEHGIDVMRNGYPGWGFGYEQMPFGLCLYAAAQKSKPLQRKKYQREANKVRSHLQNLVRAGCVNMVHHLHLLNAEFYLLKGKSGSALTSYNAAAREAARGGFIQDAGIINERLADFLFQNGTKEDARYRLEQSVNFYREWGANAKVLLLERKSAAMFQN